MAKKGEVGRHKKRRGESVEHTVPSSGGSCSSQVVSLFNDRVGASGRCGSVCAGVRDGSSRARKRKNLVPMETMFLPI